MTFEKGGKLYTQIKIDDINNPETAGCTIGGIVKQKADGKACYAVECVKNGVEKKLKFTEGGSIVTDKGEKGKSSSGTSCC